MPFVLDGLRFVGFGDLRHKSEDEHRTSNTEHRTLNVNAPESDSTFDVQCSVLSAMTMARWFYPWLRLFLQQRELHRIHQRLQAGFDDVVVDADRAPFAFAVGGLD